MTQTPRLHKLQPCIDDLLVGRPKIALGKLPGDSNRPFAEFLPENMHRASALAALCMKTADDIGGVRGLEAAVDKLYEFIGQLPPGMVEHAANLFLTQYRRAQGLLSDRAFAGTQARGCLSGIQSVHT